MKKHFETEINIQSSAENIWSVISDFDSYPKWNPFIRSISGKQEVGSTLKVDLHPPEGKSMKFTPALLVFDKNKEFRWKGKLLFKGLFDGEHYFKIEPLENGSCRFIHGEYFDGILVGMLSKTLAETEQHFKLMNEALKKRCE